MEESLKDAIKDELIKHMTVAGFALLTLDYSLETVEWIVNGWGEKILKKVEAAGGDIEYIRHESDKAMEEVLTVIRRVRVDDGVSHE